MYTKIVQADITKATFTVSFVKVSACTKQMLKTPWDRSQQSQLYVKEGSEEAAEKCLSEKKISFAKAAEVICAGWH